MQLWHNLDASLKNKVALQVHSDKPGTKIVEEFVRLLCLLGDTTVCHDNRNCSNLALKTFNYVIFNENVSIYRFTDKY